MSHIEFTISGPPKGKARPRIVRIGNRYTMADTPDNRRAEKNVREHCMEAMDEAPWDGVPLEGPCKIEVVAYFSIPPSWPKYRREAAARGEVPHLSKPDCSNILKLVEDAVNPPQKPKEWAGIWPPLNSGYAYHDDSQITDARCVKLYGTADLTIVRITPLETKGE